MIACSERRRGSKSDGSTPDPDAYEGPTARSRQPASPTPAGDNHCDASHASQTPPRARCRPQPRRPLPSARARPARPHRAQNPRARRPTPGQRHQQRSSFDLRPSWCSFSSDCGNRPTSLDATVVATVVGTTTRRSLHQFYRHDRRGLFAQQLSGSIAPNPGRVATRRSRPSRGRVLDVFSWWSNPAPRVRAPCRRGSWPQARRPERARAAGFAASNGRSAGRDHLTVLALDVVP